jgi:diguanylate cyclase (GGDEF)-like protein
MKPPQATARQTLFGALTVLPGASRVAAWSGASRSRSGASRSRSGAELPRDARRESGKPAVPRQGSLTSLLDRPTFEARLSAELRRAERLGHRVAIVALHFDRRMADPPKGPAGKGLWIVAEALASSLRPGDVGGRVSDDELMVAFVGADAAAAKEMLEGLRIRLATLELAGGGHGTISAGISEFPRHAKDGSTLMCLAGRAMYWSNRGGGNRSSVYTGEPPSALTEADDGTRAGRTSLLTTVCGLAAAVDARDCYTHLHSQRVARYAATLAASLGLDEQRIGMIVEAGVLHDVGKIGVPDAILCKPGKFTSKEYAAIKRHSQIGHDIVAGAGMPEIASWILHLHERYDGSGYPCGLARDEIPLESRILHAADALEAMTSSRVYRAGLPLADALVELELGGGAQFDAEVVASLVELVRARELEVGDRRAPAGGSAPADDLGPLVTKRARPSRRAPLETRTVAATSFLMSSFRGRS